MVSLDEHAVVRPLGGWPPSGIWQVWAGAATRGCGLKASGGHRRGGWTRALQRVARLPPNPQPSFSSWPRIRSRVWCICWNIVSGVMPNWPSWVRSCSTVSLAWKSSESSKRFMNTR